MGWRRLNARPELRMAVWPLWLQACMCGHILQPIGCAFALVCDARALQQLHCAFMWHYVSVGLYLLPNIACYSTFSYNYRNIATVGPIPFGV